jgi:hypothetical protein
MDAGCGGIDCVMVMKAGGNGIPAFGISGVVRGGVHTGSKSQKETGRGPIDVTLITV